MTDEKTIEKIELPDGNTYTLSGVDSSLIYHPPLFNFMWADHKLNDVSWLRADTFSWQSGSVYTTAYNHLVTDISGVTAETETIGSYTVTFYRATDGHKICLADQETTVANIYTETGIAWYYILDTDNTQFKLPRTKWGFEGLRSSVGNMVEQEVLLPDITGAFGKTQTISNDSYGNGAFTCVYEGRTGDANNGATNLYHWTFYASRSSSVYSGDGTNTKIQPPATEMYLYFYVGEYSRSAIEQTAGITTEQLNNKIDVDHNNDTKPYLKTTYINGTSGYNIWSNGYCEQWGKASSSNITVTLLKVFIDTNYNVQLTKNRSNSAYGPSSAYNLTSSSFEPRSNDDTGDPVFWKVSGYLAEGEY